MLYQRERKKKQLVLERRDFKFLNDTKNSKWQIFCRVLGFPDCIIYIDMMSNSLWNFMWQCASSELIHWEFIHSAYTMRMLQPI